MFTKGKEIGFGAIHGESNVLPRARNLSGRCREMPQKLYKLCGGAFVAPAKPRRRRGIREISWPAGRRGPLSWQRAFE